MARSRKCDVLYWINLHPQKRGSLEDFICALATEANQAGLHIAYVLGSRTAPLVGELFAAQGVKVFHFDQDRVASLSYRLGLLREINPRLVHYRFMGLCPPDAPLAKLMLGCKVLVADHSSGPRVAMDPPSWLKALKRLRRQLYAGQVDCYLAVSNYVAERLAGQITLPAHKIKVIYNGVDLERFSPASPEERSQLRLSLFGVSPAERVAVFVGQLSPDKGLDALLRAAPQILAPEKNHLAIIGAGPLEEEARQAAEAWGGRLQVLGLRDDVQLFLQAADVGVFPSAWKEAFGLTIAEAAACGLPVVASRVGGIPEVVAQDESGLLVPPSQVDDLAQAVSGLLSDDAARARMAVRARQRAEKLFDLKRAARLTISLYQEMLGC
jgi:glycosyltransferase involved in cell wall biosynthesis